MVVISVTELRCTGNDFCYSFHIPLAISRNPKFILRGGFIMRGWIHPTLDCVACGKRNFAHSQPTGSMWVGASLCTGKTIAPIGRYVMVKANAASCANWSSSVYSAVTRRQELPWNNSFWNNSTATFNLTVHRRTRVQSRKDRQRPIVSLSFASIRCRHRGIPKIYIRLKLAIAMTVCH